MSLDDDTTTIGEYFEPVPLVPTDPPRPAVPAELIRVLVADIRAATRSQMLNTPALAEVLIANGWRPPMTDAAEEPWKVFEYSVGVAYAVDPPTHENAAREAALCDEGRDYRDHLPYPASVGEALANAWSHGKHKARRRLTRARVAEVAERHTVAPRDVAAVVALLEDLGIAVEA